MTAEAKMTVGQYMSLVSPETSPVGVDLEIFERGSAGRVVVPNGVRINGQEVLMPEDAEIHIDTISNKSCVTATLTVLVRNLVIRSEESE